jgi:hypothetical protein
LSGGRRRAAILVREEFGLQAEGENRRMQPLRPGLSGFMAALKPEGPQWAWRVARLFRFLRRSRLAVSFIFVISSAGTRNLCA